VFVITKIKKGVSGIIQAPEGLNIFSPARSRAECGGIKINNVGFGAIFARREQKS